ncbi:hypothetical protein E2562_033720 [Oryza meyeriana var. granulata]|uniref:Uncharacterized protein n=1 Tax=Oryza meyeriana var. granulata TaxID=110450 RepID=A0A6G1C8Y4_9ORYZ|nr:hypothetical protein E2562_033720 [Oryza meyeriana var. granulata]
MLPPPPSPLQTPSTTSPPAPAAPNVSSSADVTQLLPTLPNPTEKRCGPAQGSAAGVARPKKRKPKTGPAVADFHILSSGWQFKRLKAVQRGLALLRAQSRWWQQRLRRKWQRQWPKSRWRWRRQQQLRGDEDHGLPPQVEEPAPEAMPSGAAFVSLGIRPRPIAREEALAGSTHFARASSATTPVSREAFLRFSRALGQWWSGSRRQLKREHFARVEERGWLEAAGKLLEVRGRAACTAHEQSLS